MKTLVTGAGGHIGNTIVRQLLARGREVRALVRSTSNQAGLQDDRGRLLAGLEMVYADILDRESLRPAIAGCGVVYHTAAVFETCSRPVAWDSAACTQSS